MVGNRVQQQVLLDGLDDYVGLWTVAKAVRSEHPEYDGAEVRATAVALLGPLIHGGLVQVGSLIGEGGFEAWDLDPAAALTRIDREWEALRRDPDLWEICWLSNTALGDETAKQVQASGRGDS